MAQSIQPMFSGEQMRQSMIARGQGAMTRELVREGPQAMFDPLSNPAVNRQPQAEMQYAGQQIQQNMETKGIGDTAAMLGQVRKAEAASSNAQEFMNRRLAEANVANLEATGSSSRLMELNAKLNGPERAEFLNRVALGKAQTIGANPEMAAEFANIANNRIG